MAVEATGVQFNWDGVAGHDLEVAGRDDGGDGREGFLDGEAVEGVFVGLGFQVADEDAIGALGGGGQIHPAGALARRGGISGEGFFFCVLRAGGGGQGVGGGGRGGGGGADFWVFWWGVG